MDLSEPVSNPLQPDSTAAPDVNLQSMQLGASAVVLDGRQPLWTVKEGAVDVFCSQCEDGLPSGRRTFLFRCQGGELLPAHTGNTDGLQFIVEGSPQAELQVLPVASADGFRKWVEKLTHFIAAGYPQTANVTSSGDGRIVLREGQVFHAPQHTCWVQVHTGVVSLFGAAPLSASTGPVLFPLGSDGWLRAGSDVELSLLENVERIEWQSLHIGVQTLNALALRCFVGQQKLADRVESQRLVRQRQLEDAESASSLQKLSELFHPQTSIRSIPESSLMAAMTLIGDAAGIKFRQPMSREALASIDNPVEAVADASHVRSRRVLLRGEWWRNDCGPLLGYTDTTPPCPVALLRDRWGRYTIHYPENSLPGEPDGDAAGREIRVTGQTATRLAPHAVVFYRPLPARKRDLIGLARMGFRNYAGDLFILCALALITTLAGMLLPQITGAIFGQALPEANHRMLLELILGLLAVGGGQAAFYYLQGIVALRLDTGVTSMLQAAVWDHLLRLPMKFFGQFAAGDLLNRVSMVSQMSKSVTGNTLRSFIAGVMGLLNLALLFYYSGPLALVATGYVLVSCALTVLFAMRVRRYSGQLLRIDARITGYVVQLIQGVGKLRTSGAERRAFNQWAALFQRKIRLVSSVDAWQSANNIVMYTLPTLGTLLIYSMAVSLLNAAPETTAPAATVEPVLSLGTFLAFQAAFGLFSAGATAACMMIVDLQLQAAGMKMMQTLLQEKPEVDNHNVSPGLLQGDVRLKNVVFRYREGGPLVLNDVTIDAAPGEFIALVGKSGSGKSTILRLLLGFEAPLSGSINYDHKDLAGIDLVEVRRQLGVVLQQGRLNSGSLLENIACGSQITLEQAWEAARDAGLENDIKQMPMQMHTLVSEGGGNISGGQRQRLMIARALARNPRILLFDEATSALDSETQKIVTESLNRRQVTRVVVAHRLSTIRGADRIYVLDQGRVTQRGSFEELNAQPGPFRQMMHRQFA